MFDKTRLLAIDRRQITFFALFAGMFIFTEIGRQIYRPYIYAHDIYEFVCVRCEKTISDSLHFGGI